MSWKPPRTDAEVKRVVSELRKAHRFQPGELHDPLLAATLATIIHRFGANYITPVEYRRIRHDNPPL